MKTISIQILAGLLIVPAIFPAAAANWPGWRGADGTGTSSEKNLPLKWSATENVRWRIDLPERGNSSPIVWGDRVFVTQAVSAENRRTLMCFDRTNGKLLWQSGVTYTDREQTQRDNPYCSATPVTDGERVIASFGSAGLFCFDFSGNEIWRREFGKISHQFGNGSSPVLAGDLCVLNFGPDEKARIIAVNKRTGEAAWETPAPNADGGEPPQPQQPPRAPEPERSVSFSPGELLAPRMLSQADKNGDAKIGREEFAALAQTWFDKIDKDKAGKLDSRTFGERFAELLPPPNAAPPGGGDQPGGRPFNPMRALGFGFFTASDVDRDGTLTHEEWSAAFAKWFGEWDAAKSGALDDPKLRAGLDAALPRPQSGGGGGGGGGFGGGGRGGGARGGGGSWSTPLVVKNGDHDELIVNFPGKIAALDPKSGKELWSSKGLGGASYTSPVVGGGTIVATSSGPGGGAAVALKPGGGENWKLDRFQSAIGSGVIVGGHLFTISQNGVAACNDLKTGATVWEERLKGSGSRGSSWSSMLLADGKIYVPNQGGDVFVLRAAPTFEVLATNSVNDSTNASLAASDGAVFLRTDKSLWCFANSAAK